jgi:hypothetical protein
MIFMKIMLETVFNSINNCITLLKMFKKIILMKSRLSTDFKTLKNNKMMIITSLQCKIQIIYFRNLSSNILKNLNSKWVTETKLQYKWIQKLKCWNLNQGIHKIKIILYSLSRKVVICRSHILLDNLMNFKN